MHGGKVLVIPVRTVVIWTILQIIASIVVLPIFYVGFAYGDKYWAPYLHYLPFL